MIEIIAFPNREEALESIIGTDRDYIIIRHILGPGKVVKPHFHPKANEWVIIANGEFQVRLGDEKKKLNLQHQPIAIHFPANQKHSLAAISTVSYFVLRDREDKTVY